MQIEFDILILTLFFILLDLITGFVAAIKEKDVQSSKLRDGLWHKCGFILLIILAYALEYAATFLDLGFDVPSVAFVCIYIIVTECVSIFENICILNPAAIKSPIGSIFAHTAKIKEAERLEAEKRGNERG